MMMHSFTSRYLLECEIVECLLCFFPVDFGILKQGIRWNI